MKRTILPVVAALLAAFILPSQVFAQPFPRNTNYSRKFRSVIVGGFGNLMMSNARASVIAGGAGNTIDNAWYSFIGGGDSHRVSGENCTIGGGTLNVAGPAIGATVSGGLYNEASGYCATVPGGNVGKATHDYSFVWGADSSYEQTSSFGNQTFTVRCEGGARFYSATGTGTGVQLASGSGTWTSLSDRNAKENFDDVNASEVLAKVAAMPIKTWNYKTQADSIRHIGPTAQDFKSAFGVGESETGITTVDADGVALAAIKGLAEELKERDREIEKLKTKSAEFEAKAVEVDALKAKFQALEQRLNALPPAP
jgi:Chaperone of endosialidase